MDVNDGCRIITGRSAPNLLARTFDFFGDNVKKAAGVQEEERLDPNDPYKVLDVRRGACNRVVKASYRSLVRDVHPDTGEHPDPKRFQQLTEAYDKIMSERKEK